MASPRYAFSADELEATIQALDTIVFGAWAPRLAGMDPATRTFAFHGGTGFDGVDPVIVPDDDIVCPDNLVTYVQRTPAGVVSVAATLDPDLLPMAQVTCASGVMTQFDDIRDLALPMLLYRILNP